MGTLHTVDRVNDIPRAHYQHITLSNIGASQLLNADKKILLCLKSAGKNPASRSPIRRIRLNCGGGGKKALNHQPDAVSRAASSAILPKTALSAGKSAAIQARSAARSALPSCGPAATPR
jgi:hypothetical protein